MPSNGVSTVLLQAADIEPIRCDSTSRGAVAEVDRVPRAIEKHRDLALSRTASRDLPSR